MGGISYTFLVAYLSNLVKGYVSTSLLGYLLNNKLGKKTAYTLQPLLLPSKLNSYWYVTNNHPRFFEGIEAK